MHKPAINFDSTSGPKAPPFGFWPLVTQTVFESTRMGYLAPLNIRCAFANKSFFGGVLAHDG